MDESPDLFRRIRRFAPRPAGPGSLLPRWSRGGRDGGFSSRPCGNSSIEHTAMRPSRALSADEPLVSSGIIDSFGLVDLSLFVEERFRRPDRCVRSRSPPGGHGGRDRPADRSRGRPPPDDVDPRASPLDLRPGSPTAFSRASGAPRRIPRRCGTGISCFAPPECPARSRKPAWLPAKVVVVIVPPGAAAAFRLARPAAGRGDPVDLPLADREAVGRVLRRERPALLTDLPRDGAAHDA